MYFKKATRTHNLYVLYHIKEVRAILKDLFSYSLPTNNYIVCLKLLGHAWIYHSVFVSLSVISDSRKRTKSLLFMYRLCTHTNSDNVGMQRGKNSKLVWLFSNLQIMWFMCVQLIQKSRSFNIWNELKVCLFVSTSVTSTLALANGEINTYRTFNLCIVYCICVTLCMYIFCRLSFGCWHCCCCCCSFCSIYE